MFILIDVNRALPAQARHAERAPQCDLNPGDIKRQGMEVEKPFTNEIPDILQAQYFLIEHSDPFSATAADQLFDGFRTFVPDGKAVIVTDQRRRFDRRRILQREQLSTSQPTERKPGNRRWQSSQGSTTNRRRNAGASIMTVP